MTWVIGLAILAVGCSVGFVMGAWWVATTKRPNAPDALYDDLGELTHLDSIAAAHGALNKDYSRFR